MSTVYNVSKGKDGDWTAGASNAYRCLLLKDSYVPDPDHATGAVGRLPEGAEEVWQSMLEGTLRAVVTWTLAKVPALLVSLLLVAIVAFDDEVPS